MIYRMKQPIHSCLRTGPIRVNENLFESIACFLLVGANVDGKGLPEISHVGFAVQLRQVTVHHQFEETHNLTILTTKNAISFDA